MSGPWTCALYFWTRISRICSGFEVFEHNLQSSFTSSHCWDPNVGPIPKVWVSKELCWKLTSLPGVTSWKAKGLKLMRREGPGEFSRLFQGDLEGYMLWLARPGLAIPVKTRSVDACKQMAGRQRETLTTRRKPTEELFFHQCRWVAMPGRCPRGTRALAGRGPDHGGVC